MVNGVNFKKCKQYYTKKVVTDKFYTSVEHEFTHTHTHTKVKLTAFSPIISTKSTFRLKALILLEAKEHEKKDKFHMGAGFKAYFCILVHNKYKSIAKTTQD